MTMDDKLIAVIGTAIVGLLPLIANPIISAVQRRGRRARRDDAISVAKERVEFVESWIKAQELVSTAERLAEQKKAASQELDEIRGGVLKSLEEATHTPTPIADRHFVERALLLYRPNSVGGWLWHTLFYMTVLMFIAIEALTVLSVPNLSASDAAYNVKFALVFGVIAVILAFVFRGLAAVVDRDIQDRLRAEADSR
jgi:hypothetical protein